MLIGDIIKQKRQEMNLTQGELAEGICTQAMISRIEKHLVEPSKKLQKKLADKLQVSVSYFHTDNDPVDTRLSNLEVMIRDYLNKTEYGTVNELVISNKEIIENSNNQYFEIFFNWVESILTYNMDDNADIAIHQLNKLLDNDNITTELSIDISNSLGIIYYEKGDYNKASTYYELVLENFDDSTFYKKRVRILYNYSLNLESLKQYKEALNLVLEAIEILIEKQSFYMLGYLYFFEAYLLRDLDQKREAVEAYENAYSIFKILGYKKMMIKTNIELKEVEDSHEK